MDQNEVIKRLWEANEDLCNQKILPVVLDPLEKKEVWILLVHG